MPDVWPSLTFADWRDTCATLHLWTQIVGKVRLAQTPWLNHSWHVTLYVTARGLTTSPMPHGDARLRDRPSTSSTTCWSSRRATAARASCRCGRRRWPTSTPT